MLTRVRYIEVIYWNVDQRHFYLVPIMERKRMTVTRSFVLHHLILHGHDLINPA